MKQKTLREIVIDQQTFSQKTFGPGIRTKGIVAHIRKELKEIEQAPFDLSEWADVVLLALDGAWRHGYTPEEIVNAIVDKQRINRQREWCIDMDPDKPVKHIKCELRKCHACNLMLVYMKCGESKQTDNGFLIARVKGWYCPKCAGSYGK